MAGFDQKVSHQSHNPATVTGTFPQLFHSYRVMQFLFRLYYYKSGNVSKALKEHQDHMLQLAHGDHKSVFNMHL